MKLLRMCVATLLVAAGLVLVPRPAVACACGAVVTTTAASVSGETALVTWDGATETIDMVLRLEGSAADAAWIMPTPAGAEIGLGDRTVFPKLVAATAPRVEKNYRYWPERGGGVRVGAGAPAGAATLSVTVSTVGPFTVSTLSGTDAGAVSTWLADHGYPTRPALTPTFASYLSQGWAISAVKLTSPGGTLTGDLDPLRMRFAATSVVYPIRLSAHAASWQRVTLFVAAAHRMAVTTGATSAKPQVLFAGLVPASQVGVAALAGENVYLTAFSQQLDPAQISSDYVLAQAPDDSPYQQVVYETVDRTWVVPLAGLVLVLVGAGVVVALLVRARRSRSARPS